MFKLLLISIAIVPIALGITAANGRTDAKARSVLRIRWILYVTLWIGLLYFVSYRWT